MRTLLFLLCAATAVGSGEGRAAELTATKSASVASGRYGGSETTELMATSFSLQANVGEWRVRASIPRVQVRSGGTTPVAIGGAVVRDARGQGAGYGDLQLRVDRPVKLPIDLAALELSAEIKLPTGARHLSTRKVDAGLTATLSRPIGPVTPHLALGYRVRGDSPYLPLADGWTASAGVTVLTSRTVLMLSYETSQSTIAGPAPHELFAVMAREVSPGWSLSLFGSKGLSAGASRTMSGMALTHSFR